jgi:hypothetical protein
LMYVGFPASREKRVFEKCKRAALTPALVGLFLSFSVSPNQVLAQADPRFGADAMRDIAEFSKHLDEFKKAGSLL